MKKIKIGLPILALVLAVAASAFTTVSSKEDVKPLALKFWRLVDLNNPQDPASYVEVTSSQAYNSISCSGDETVCKMQAQDDGAGHPQFQDGDNDGIPDEDGTLVTEVILRDF